MSEAPSSIDHHQLRGAGWDIVHEAIGAYDCWMLDDDYDANRVLREIIQRMRFRRSLYMPCAQLRADNERLRGLLARYQVANYAPKDSDLYAETQAALAANTEVAG